MPKVVPQYKEEAKERIIQAALDVYAEKGPYEATMDDVAKKLGVSKGALYLYFKSKDELLYEIIKRPEQSVRRFLQSLLETKDLSKSLDDVLEHDIREPTEQRRNLIFDFMAEATRNPTIRKALSETYEASLRTLMDFLTNTRTGSRLNTEEKRRKAISLLSLYVGILASSALGANTSDLRDAWRQSIKAILAKQPA